MAMQLILGHAFTQSQYNALQNEIKSSVIIDNVKQGATPGNAPDGILCTFKVSPLAFHGTPTLNKMVFSKKLWQSLMDNQGLKSAMELKAHYGELDHPQSSEVSLQCVCNRVNSLDFGPKDLVVGDIDIVDTPMGLIHYSLCKSGRVGISSRGFGELRPIENGLQEVVCDTYSHVSFDSVGLPAVPTATMTLLSPNIQQHLTQDDIAEDLRRLVAKGLDKWSSDPLLNSVNELLNKGKTVYSIPSSVSQPHAAGVPSTDALSKVMSKHAIL